MIGSNLTLTTKVGIALGATSGVMALTFVGLAVCGSHLYGHSGVSAAALAAAVCWISGVVALSAMLLHRDPTQAVSGVMFGMLFRMGLPLVVGVSLQSSGSELVKAGVIGMIVIAYQLGLFIETLMAWWILESSESASRRTAKAS